MNLAEYLLRSDVVSFQAEADDWKAAIKLGTDLLERVGAVRPEYYQGICDNVEQLGPYFLLAPGLAMPHARPEQGVITDGFALVTLREPVNFGDPDNDPVDILITMAAQSSEQQNEYAIVQIVELLDDEERVSALKTARNKEDLQKIFATMENT